MDNLQENVDFILNGDEVKRQTAKIKDDIAGVGFTAEKAAKYVEDSIASVGSQQAKMNDQVNKAGGLLAANAKRASGSFNGLQNSINQISRELPAFTYSVQTGFMAVSNNIPMLFDEVAKLRKENNELIASGQKGKSVTGQLVSSLLSWNTALSLGVTILTVYGKEIVNWIGGMIGAKNATNEFKKSLESINKSYIESFAKEKSALESLLITANNDKLSKEDRIDAVKRLNQLSPEYLGGITLEKLKTEESTRAIDNYVLSLKRLSIEKAVATKRDELSVKRLELADEYSAAKSNLEDYRTGKKAGKATYINQGTAQGTASTVDYRKNAEKRFKKIAEADQLLVDQINKLDRFVQGQLEASTDKKDKDVVNRNKAFYQNIIATNQAALDQLDSSAADFKAKSAIYKKAINEAKENLAGYDPTADKKTAAKEQKELDRTLNSRKSLLKRIEALDDEYARKSFDKDAEEVQALKDKFAQMRTIVEDFNKKNPKQAISLDDLKEREGKAVVDLEYKQNLDRVKKTVEQEKRLYAEYEEYKSVFGNKAAKERYNDQINTETTFLQQIEAKRAELLKTDPTEMTGGQKDYLEYLNQQEASELENRRKTNTDLLREAQTFEEALIALKDRYTAKIDAMRGTASAGNLEQMRKAYQEERDALIEQNAAKTELARRLAEEAIVLTRSQISNQIKVLENSMKDVTIPDDFKEKIKAQIDNLKLRLDIGVDQSNLDVLKAKRADIIAGIGVESQKAQPQLEKFKQELQAVNEQIEQLDKNGDGKADKGLKGFLKGLKDNKALIATATGLSLASEAASTLSEGLGGVNTEAGYTLDTIGQLAGAAGDLAGAIASGNPAQMIGAAIKGVGTLFSIGKKVKEMNLAARKEVADFYAQAISGEREYQELLAERAVQTVRDNKTALKGITDEIALRKAQAAAYNKESLEIMAKLQGMQYIQDEEYKHGTWFRKAKVNKTYGSLQGRSFNDLQLLLTQGKLEGDAKTLVERLVELEQKGYDAEQALADLAKQSQEIFTGTTSDEMTNSLLEMFRNGEAGVADLADFFKKTMDDAALSIFKNKVLAGAMEEFYKQFSAKTADGELSANDYAELEKLYGNMTAGLNKEFEALKKITGSDLSGSSNSSKSGLSAGIRKELTDEGVNVLAGLYRSQYDITKQQLEVAKASNQVFQDQLRAQNETAMNTAAMLSAQNLTNSKLDEIIINTQSTPASQVKRVYGG